MCAFPRVADGPRFPRASDGKLTTVYPHLPGPFLYADVMNSEQLEALIVDYNIDKLVHFSALLSAVGEQNVHRALDVNIQGFARCPSSHRSAITCSQC